MPILRDLRFGLRTLLRNPTSSLVCILTLALGIGANTAIFSVIDALILRPLPYPEPARLVQLQQTYQEAPGVTSPFFSGPTYLALRERLESFQSLTALYNYSPEGFNLNLDGRSQRIARLKVSSDYFDTLGIQPQIGRTFTREEELMPGPQDSNRLSSYEPANRLALLSNGLWMRILGGDPGILGSTILLSGAPYTVIGVMPPGVLDPMAGRIDVWVPHNLSAGGYNNLGNRYLTVLGRLSPEVTIQAAQHELDAAMAVLESTHDENQGEGARLDSLQELLLGDLDSTLYILLAAVLTLLLIACVNVANLQLSQYAGRSRELAIRAAVGGSRRQLARQLLTENLLLVLGGGLLGVVLARLGVVALLSLSPEGLQDNVAIQFNSNVLLFTTLMALSTGIIFGLAPAWRSSRLDLDQVLRQNSRGSVAGHGRTGRLLVIGQISLSLVLLIAAALLMSSFRSLLTQENTLRREGVYTFRVDLSGPKYERGEQRANFNRELGSALTALPGVEATGAISKLPLTGPYHGWGFRIPGRDPESEQGGGPAQIRVVDRDYFQALRIPLLRGRLLDSSDRADSSPSVLINRALADRYFEDEDAVGKVLSMGGNRTVVGVVGNVRHRHLLPASPKIYVAHAQFADNRNWQLYQIVSTTTERADIFALIRQQVGRLDSGVLGCRRRGNRSTTFCHYPDDPLRSPGSASGRGRNSRDPDPDLRSPSP